MSEECIAALEVKLADKEQRLPRRDDNAAQAAKR